MGAHTSDGSVIIDTQLNDGTIDKDLQKLILKLANMNLKIEKQTRDVQGLQKAYDDLIAGTRKGADETGLEKSLARTQARINMMLSDKSGIGIISKSINEAIQKNATINPNLGDTEIGKEFINLTQKAEALKQKLSEIKINPAASTEAQDLLFKINTMNNNIKIMQIDAEQASEKINDMGKSTDGIENFDNKVKELKNDLDQLSQTEGLRKVVSQTQSVGTGLKQATSLTNRFKNAFSSIGGVANTVGSRISQAFSQIRNSTNSGTSAVGQFGRRILRLANTAFIFNLFRHGFLNLRHAMGNLIQHDDQLSASLRQIQANLLTAFAPIWNACLPAIQALGKALSWLSALIASVVSALFGKTITQSQQMAKNIYASSQATKKLKTNLGKVKKEAKETNKVLASFDKINVLNDEKPKNALGKLDEKNLDNTQGDLNTPGGTFKPLEVPILFKFQEENKELINKITQIFQNMARILKPINKGIVDDVTWLWNQVFKSKEGSWLDWLNDTLKGIADFIEDHPKFKDYLVSLAEGIAILSVAILIFNAISWINPWFLLAAIAIGTLIFVIKHADEILEGFKNVLKTVGDALEDVGIDVYGIGDNIVKVFQKVGEAVMILWNLMKPFVKWLWDGFINYLISWATDLGNLLKGIFQGVSQRFNGMLLMIQGALDIFIGLFTGDWNRMWNGMGEVVKGFIESFKGTVNILASIAENIVNVILWMVNGAIRAINGINLVGFGVPSIPEIPKARIPRLAQGAVLNGGNPFLAWVNDQPKGQTNVETPLSTMVDAFRVAMKDMGNNQQPINIQATGNVSEMIRFLNFKIKQEQGLQGTNFVTGDSWA